MLKSASIIVAIATLSFAKAGSASQDHIQIDGHLPQHDAAQILAVVQPHVPKGERVLRISVKSGREVDVYTGASSSSFGGSVFSLRKRHNHWTMDSSVKGYWNA
jgi:hypothetical protein